MKAFKAAILTFSVIFLSSTGAFAAKEKRFPKIPEPDVTPGHLCENPSEHRYEERIPYCRRDVTSSRKWDIIDYYDDEYGYEIREVGRQNFKVDHFIPLCMGGSNEDENLWPQHRSVYEQSDPWEQSLCVDLAAGNITWAKALETIRKVKLNVK